MVFFIRATGICLIVLGIWIACYLIGGWAFFISLIKYVVGSILGLFLFFGGFGLFAEAPRIAKKWEQSRLNKPKPKPVVDPFVAAAAHEVDQLVGP